MKSYASKLCRRDDAFQWLPKEQRLTEASLIQLERQIAKSVKKNESVLTQSEEMAARTTLR